MKKELYGTNVPIDLYNTDIAVVWGDKEKAKIYTDYIPPNREGVIDDNVMGWCNVRDDGRLYVYLGTSLKNYHTIVHELTHAILFTTHQLGIMVSDEPCEHETTTYLFGYVIGSVLETKKKKWWIWRGNKKFEPKWIKQK